MAGMGLETRSYRNERPLGHPVTKILKGVGANAELDEVECHACGDNPMTAHVKGQMQKQTVSRSEMGVGII